LEPKRTGRISIKLNGADITERQKQTAGQAAPAHAPAAPEPKRWTFPAVDRGGDFTGSQPGLPKGEDAFTRLRRLQLEVPASEPREYVLLDESSDEGKETYSGQAADDPPHFSWEGWRPSRKPPFSLLLAAASAVSLGLLFGFGAMSVFQQEQVTKTYQTVLDGTFQTLTAANPAGTPSGAKTAGNDSTVPASATPAAEDPAGAPASLHLPQLSVYMAQVGVFKDKANAQSAVDSLQKQGLPHFLYEHQGDHYVFVATAPTRDDILGLGSVLKNKQMEVHVRELVFPAGDKQLGSNQAAGASAGGSVIDPLERFFATGSELARSLSILSSRVANDSQGQKRIPQEEEASAKELHLRFLEESRACEAVIPEQWKPFVTEMVNGINQAFTAMTKAKTDNAQPYAWQAQGGILRYYENYMNFTRQLG
jgi:cell division septation protein DedD